MKKKRSKKEISEQARREAENSPTVRRLRELYANGMAELQARKEAAGIDQEKDLAGCAPAARG